MLSRAKITPGSVRYYEAEVASSPEDYYLGRGEAPGQWVGSGSAAEELDGEVVPEQLQRLFAGLHPDTGEPLGAAYRVRAGAQKVSGWDLTFSAPKSVSALWAVGGEAVGLEVKDAHAAAVSAGLAYLEAHACFSRTGKAGIAQVDTDGLLAAACDHRTSRAGDPQLHTHVLVSGRVRCADGAWRALDSRALHAELKSAGMVYQAALRAELTARLGVAWTTPDRHGQAEVLGVPEDLLEHWSSRRVEIETLARLRCAEAERDLGRPLTAEERREAYQQATLDTRPAKVHCGDGIDEGLFDRWRADAVEVGCDGARWVPHALGRSVEAVSSRDVPAEALAELERSASIWSRTDVVRQIVRRLPTGATASAEEARRRTEQLVDEVLADGRTLCLAAPEEAPPADLLRRDGRSVFEHHGARRFSTREALAAEQQILDRVTAGREAQRAVVNSPIVQQAVAAWGLSRDQADVVRRLTAGGEAVSCLVGPAGTGKSRTVGAAAAAWTGSGTAVRGLAVSASAAGVLAAEAGIPADTLARFLLDHERPGASRAPRLGAGEVVVLDEAGMVASADLAQLLLHAERAGAKVVLVGDPRQLGPVGAGGLFGLLARKAAQLNSVHRFAEAWEREACLRLRDGDQRVLADYDDHGRLGGGAREEVLEQALARWRAARVAGESVVVCAPDHTTVDELALRARAERVATGEVEPSGVRAGGQVVGEGDEVVTTRNDRALLTTGGGWVRNGDRWVVLERFPDGGLLVEDSSGRGRAQLPGDYVRSDVRLAYAVTLHKAQGLTVDHGVVVVDDRTSAAALYVGMTRGRLDNVALAVTEDALDEHQRPEWSSPVEVLERALARSGAQRSGLEVVGTALEESRSLATLVPRLAHVEAWIRREEPPDRSRELQWARRNLERFERHGRPGLLTSQGRADRVRGHDLRRQLAALEAEQTTRTSWLEEHADSLAYRDRLAEAVADRRQELGLVAVADQPAHLIDLLGPVPHDERAAQRWRRLAEGVEAYREEWKVTPERLHEHPGDPVQRQRWQESVREPVRVAQLLKRHAERQLRRARGREHNRSEGLGIDR